ncbi:RICIN domain-containing protein [Streptomyces sp. CA-249302]|uniref:RICIN domain-containing protein n=1 Tax=Streptomyces sp. CA-249302 TaxID=3240058 RepID=UPI003D916FB3
MALVTAVFAVLAIGWATGAPAQAAGFNSINVLGGHHCLDNATQDSAKLQMWNCTGGAEQKWLEEFNSRSFLYTFINQDTGRCMTAPSSGTGTVVMLTCNAAAANQQWNIFLSATLPAGQYEIWQNASSGFCLHTSSVGDGNLVDTAPCSTLSLNQRWHTQV